MLPVSEVQVFQPVAEMRETVDEYVTQHSAFFLHRRGGLAARSGDDAVLESQVAALRAGRFKIKG